MIEVFSDQPICNQITCKHWQIQKNLWLQILNDNKKITGKKSVMSACKQIWATIIRYNTGSIADGADRRNVRWPVDELIGITSKRCYDFETTQNTYVTINSDDLFTIFKCLEKSGHWIKTFYDKNLGLNFDLLFASPLLTLLSFFDMLRIWKTFHLK